MRLTKERAEKYLRMGLDCLQKAEEAESDQRQLMLDDLRFSWGDQWDDAVRRERERDNRPCETFDRLGDIIRKAMRNIRQNRPSIKTFPVEGGDDETAEVIEDLIREIEYASGGSQPYLWASECAMRMGYGAFEVCQADSEHDVFAQDIRIKRVANPFTVYFDPDSRHPVKADGKFAVKTLFYSEDEFREKWPKADLAGISSGTLGERYERWYADGKIRVAQVWKRTPVTKTVVLLSDGRQVFEDQLTEQDGQLQIVKVREVETTEIWRWTQTGTEFLDKPAKWPGRYIPLIPVYGEEINIEGEVQYRGITRQAKGAMRMYNYHRNAEIEMVAQQPKPPWLIGMRQMTEALKPLWARANSSKLPYLLYDDSVNTNPPQRQVPPMPSQGAVLQAQQAADDIQRTTGFFDATLGAPSNEQSGRAITARKMGAEDGVLVFGDNLAASIEQCGRVIIDLIPHFYDTERVMRLRGEDDARREVTINQRSLEYDPIQGVRLVTKIDLTRGKYDVRVAAGRGYATRRAEEADELARLIDSFPQAAPLIADLFVTALDVPHADEIAKRLRTLVPPGVIDEDDPEKQQVMQAARQKQEAIEQLMVAEKQAGIQKDAAQTAKYLADARKSTADAEQTAFETGRGEAI